MQGVYYLGTKRPEDKAVLARRARRFNTEELMRSAENFLNDDGKCTVLPDGIVIVADTLATIERINEMIDRVESAPSVTWCVQVHIISFSDKDLKDFGMDVNPALELAAGYANLHNVAAAITSGIKDGISEEGGRSAADVSLKAVLRATRERGSMRIVCDPLFTCVDGAESKVTRGLKIPVRTTLTTGTNNQNTQTQLQFVQTGLEARASVREVSETMGRLKLDLTLADLTQNDSVGPTTDNQSLNLTTDVETGGVYLLGGLRRSRDESKTGAFFSFGTKRNNEADVWLVWAKTYRIAKALQ